MDGQTAVGYGDAGLTATAAHRASFIERTDGTALFYRDWGTGKPIVFVAGAEVPSAMWAYQMVPLVQAGFRCVAFDRRGHGRSSDPGRGYDFDTLSDDLAAVIETLDLRGVTLVGHSMGCGEIVRYLTRHGSARVARVALLAPTTPFSTAELICDRELKVYEGAPHGLFLTHIERLNGELLRFASS